MGKAPRTIRAHLVDPATQTITEVTIAETLDAWYATLGCETVQSIRLGADAILVDEDGRLKPQRFGFRFPTLSPHSFVGRGLVVGHGGGSELSAAPGISAAELRAAVEWLAV